MQSLQGVVTIVQEGRFQLVDDDGVAHLFVLGYQSPAEPEQLMPLQHSQARVRVSYIPAEGLIGHQVRKITVLDAC